MSEHKENRAVTFIRVPAWEDDRTSQYEEWYDAVHIPHRMRQPGFLGAQRYETTLGRQSYFVLYELADPGAAETPEYIELRRWEASQPPDSFEAPATSRPGFERGIYDQLNGPDWPDTRLMAPVIYVAGYQPAEDREDLLQNWLAVEHGPGLEKLTGVNAVRLFKSTSHGFGGCARQTQMHTPYPRVMSITYLADESVLRDAAFVDAHKEARAVEAEPDREPYIMIGRLVHTAYGKSL